MHFSRFISAPLLTLFFLHSPANSHVVQPTSSSPSTPIYGDTTTLIPQFFPKEHSQRIKIRYGPYTVPGMHTDNGMISFGGRTVTPPCTSCLLTYIQAGLEYSNGTTASAHNGMWLHHTVWTNLNRNGSTCPSKKAGDRFFASGNERTPIDLTVGGAVKAGYEVEDGDVWAMGGELMNMRHDEAEVVLSMVWEFIPSVPKGFRKVKSYWLDVGGCKGSKVPAEEDKKFEYESPSWKSEDEGRILFLAGHLHDGGTHAEIRRNGQVICDSKASYETCEADGEDAEEEQHISKLSVCRDLGHTKPGDEWTVRAYYDTTKHAPMKNMDGTLEPVMGISLVYVALGGRHGHGHKKLKIFLAIAVVVLTTILVRVWARKNGRDWLLRKKRRGVVLGDSDGDSGSSKGRWYFVGGRYRDE